MDSINKMFSILKEINKNLLKKYEDNDVSFLEKYIFEATSYYISIAHEKEISKNITYTTIYMYKSLIEVLTIIYIYMNKDNNELNELLNNYNYKKEELIFNKYKDIIDINLFRFKEIKYVDYDEELTKIKLPYLFNDDFSLLIKNNLDKLYDYYLLINKYIGLDDINTSFEYIKSNEFKNKLNVLDSALLMYLYSIVLKYYSNIKPKDKNTLDYEKNYIINHPDVTTYMNFVFKENEILEELGSMTNNKLFNVIGLAIINLAVDKLYGFTETLDTKLISIIEVAANYYKMYKGNNEANYIDIFIDDLYKNEYNAYLKLLYDESKKLNNLSGYLIKSYIDVNYEYTKIIKILDDIVLFIFELLNDKYPNIIDIKEKFIKISNQKNDYDLNNFNI